MMSTGIAFLLITIIFIFGLFEVVWLSWWSSKRHWVDYTDYAIKQFSNEVDFSKIIFFQNDRKNYYLASFYFGFICNILLLTIFLLLWILIWDNNLYLIGIILFWLLSNWIFYLVLRKFFNTIKRFKIEVSQISNHNFKQLIEDNHSKKEYIDFILMKDSKKAPRDWPFHIQQRRFKKKINRIKKQNISNQEKTLKLLRAFILYIKIYGFFFEVISLQENKYKVNIKNQTFDVDKLKLLLINNFFSFINQ